MQLLCTYAATYKSNKQSLVVNQFELDFVMNFLTFC